VFNVLIILQKIVMTLVATLVWFYVQTIYFYPAVEWICFDLKGKNWWGWSLNIMRGEIWKWSNIFHFFRELDSF
jgi:hypothetical protein